ncbi:MAG: hypothetical protein AAF713_02245 [Pseudomonadota bacterium]
MSQKTDYDPYRLVKFLALWAADGVAAGWTLLLILMRLDIGGLSTYIYASESGGTAMAMLVVFFGITFSMVGIGYGVMVVLPEKD